MCLILTAKEYVPHIAEEDIPCFKHSYKRKGSDFLIGPFTYYVYLNVKYHKSVTLTAKINPILHEDHPRRIVTISEGIHAYQELPFKRRKNYAGSILMDAIIPKGTLYYRDGRRIVAEKMILLNPFEIKP